MLLVSAGMAVICVAVHFAFIRALLGWLIHRGGVGSQWRILATVLALITSHLLQILAFGGAYATLHHFAGYAVGDLDGSYRGYSGLAYFSAIVYTTVGFGDIVPVGPARLLVATEALVGLMLVAWSASFTFLVMNRYLRERTGHGGSDASGLS